MGRLEPMGTLAWGERRQGRLTRAETLRMIANLAFVQAREAKDWLGSMLGLLRPDPIEIEALSPPDSALVRDALAHAEATHQTALLRHSWRTFYLGALIARHDDIPYDPEVFFAAAILHDLGLTQTHPVPLSQCCFGASGGHRAREHLHHCGHPQAAEAVGDAIALHLNVYVSRRLHGPEAFLLARGAVCDLFGAGWRRVAQPSRLELHRRFPRDGVIEALQFETADHMAGSRAALLTRLSGGKAPRTPYPETNSLL
jgi:hypothetical protein